MPRADAKEAILQRMREPHGDTGNTPVAVTGPLPPLPTSVSCSNSLRPMLSFSSVPQSHDKSCG